MVVRVETGCVRPEPVEGFGGVGSSGSTSSPRTGYSPLFPMHPLKPPSHAFSDQKSFVLNAFGQPLAISSGYREYYGRDRLQVAGDDFSTDQYR